MRKNPKLSAYSLFLSFIGILSFSACNIVNQTSLGTNDANKPNIIYILADDLGYGELGVYGQEIIETPHIDALAKEGMRFTQHYAGSPVCAPSRCVLLTGQHAGHAYVRGNDEWGERGKVWDYQAMFDDPFLEGQRPLPDSIITLAEVLQSAGYKTGAVGKWGLGAPTTEGVPNKQGFDFFFGYNCQRQAHTFYPMHLWKNEERVLLDNKFVPLHANLEAGADPNDPDNYADFQLNDYSPDLIQQEALDFVKENKNHPFFLYYASLIPHLPLQAPQDWVEYYQKKLGPEEPFIGKSYFPNRTPSATYAAMITYMDQQVGELVKELKEQGLYENTLIIFSSDNGPTYVGGVDAERFNSAGPFKEGYGYTKGFVHEGGIRVPMIASWPGHIKPGSTSDHPSAFYDVMPTLSEVAKGTLQSQTDGISFLPTLLGQEQKKHDYLYWEFPSYTGQQAVRMGPWKGIRKNIFAGNTELELFNLDSDIEEQINVAAQYPEVAEQIQSVMTEAHTPASLDRFKMEPLGDVKTTYLEAVKRTKTLRPTPKEITLQEGYFTLSRQTRIKEVKEASKAAETLQNRLQETGAYQLKKAEQKKKNTLIFSTEPSISDTGYVLSIDKGNIRIQAKEEAGFSHAIEALLQLMDKKIFEQKEMHNPQWVVAAVKMED